MTDLIDRADSGEIPPLPGEYRMRIDLGEKTQRIDPRLIKAPSFDAIPRKVIEIDETVYFHIPETIGVVPDPETEQLTVLGSLTADITGEFHPSAPGPQPGPLPPDPQPAPDPQPGYAGRHRLSWGGRVRRLSPWWALAGVVVFGLAIWAGLYWAAAVVFP
jgi:hypothetical protein